MPCEKYSQVAGTLIPQESRTLRSNQLFKDVTRTIQNNNLLRESQIKKPPVPNKTLGTKG
jgi:hypothetical protein